MVYPSAAIGNVSFLPTKLLGCYEPELWPNLAHAHGFDLFVDVGAGEGYYCVGFKQLFPGTRVIGYETDGFERRTAAKLAELNGVSIEMRGTANHEALNALPNGRLLLMTDVEGYEHQLADPILVPRLGETTMIIEAHPSVHPDIVDVFRSRFTRSHDIELVGGLKKGVIKYPELAGWDESLARCAITEGRAIDPLWLVLRPRARTS
jgi:hypothetical protein